jgi:hypothetical protein
VRFAAADDFRFLGRKRIFRIDHALRLDEHAVTALDERHEISLPHAEVVENLAGNDHLKALAEAADRFPHYTRCRKLLRYVHSAA